MRPALSPRDCAVLVAVPLTRDEFLRSASAAVRGGFVDNLVRGRVAAWVWDAIYRPIAGIVERILGDVEDMGATVIRGATVDALASATRTAQAVTMIAHWRFPGLSADEILAVPELLAFVQAAGTGPLARFQRVPAGELVARLCEEVASGERYFHELERQEVDLWLGEIETQPAQLHRLDLEHQLPATILRRAEVVEFADGFQTAEAIIAGIPLDYPGILDLSICNSAVLGLAVRNRREHCLAVVNRRQSPLEFAVAKYRAVIRLLSQRPRPYTDAIFTIHRAASESLP